MSFLEKNTHTTLSFLILISAASYSLAQPGSGQIEEVFVTANKLGSASLQEMPTAVVLFTGEDLRERGATEFADFAAAVPSLQFQDLGPGDKEYIIRGTNSSGPSTVGVYFDETPITGSNAQDGGGRNVEIKLVDLDIIEIFNGPQGTQYGANSMSGLIRYVPVKPKADQLDGWIETDFSETSSGGNNFTLNATLNVPIIENVLALRLVGWSTDNDGWIDQPRLIGGGKDNVNDEDTDGGRVMLRWLATDETIIDFMYLTQDLTIGGSSRHTPKGTTSFGTDPVADGTGWYADPILIEDDYINQDLTLSAWDEEMEIISLTLSHEFEFGSFTATTSSFDREIIFSFDATAFTPQFPWSIVQPQIREVDFTELRFSSDFDGDIQFFIGASARKETNDWESWGVTVDDSGVPNPIGQTGAAASAFGNLVSFSPPQWTSTGQTIYTRYVDFELEQQAVFGEVSWESSDKLTLTFGARYFQSDQKQTEGGGVATTTGPFVTKGDDSKVTGKVTAAYQWEDDINVYGQISQGFRVGGVNNSESLTSDLPSEYTSDELTSYEVGLKTQFDDGNITLNVALYYIDWDDIQLEATAGSVPFTTNAGSAGITGLELQYRASLSENLYFDFNASYTNAELTEDQPLVDAGDEDVEQGLDGDKIPNIPERQFYAALVHTTSIDWGELTIRGDIGYRSESDIRFRPGGPQNYTMEESSVMNGRIGLKMDSGLSIAFYIKNITNELAVYDAVNTVQDPLAITANRPRTMGFNIYKEFN